MCAGSTSLVFYTMYLVLPRWHSLHHRPRRLRVPSGAPTTTPTPPAPLPVRLQLRHHPLLRRARPPRPNTPRSESCGHIPTTHPHSCDDIKGNQYVPLVRTSASNTFMGSLRFVYLVSSDCYVYVVYLAYFDCLLYAKYLVYFDGMLYIIDLVDYRALGPSTTTPTPPSPLLVRLQLQHHPLLRLARPPRLDTPRSESRGHIPCHPQPSTTSRATSTHHISVRASSSSTSSRATCTTCTSSPPIAWSALCTWSTWIASSSPWTSCVLRTFAGGSSSCC